MSRKHYGLVIGAIVAIICLGMVWWPEPSQPRQHQKSSPLPNDFTQTKSVKTKASPRDMSEPRTLRIPALKLEAPIESVGLTKSGDMDVPSSDKSVGWYRFGPVPGDIGNAVLAGHLDVHGKPAIFWDLQNLRLGDVIEIKDDKGQTARFKVNATQAFKLADAPLERIFGNSDQRHLNLITCSGAWHNDQRDYSERLVVFTQLLE